MNRIQKYNLAFVHSPKCGGTSVSNWLKKIGRANHTRLSDGKNDTHNSIPSTLVHNNMKREDLGFVFTTVRNPWAREFSNYTHIMGRVRDYPASIANVKKQVTDFSSWVELFNGNSFEHYHKDETKSPQAYWTQQCDLVIKLEELDKEFYKIQDILKSKENLVNKNVRFEDREEWKKHYNKDTIDIVYKAHEEDIKKYNYDF